MERRLAARRPAQVPTLADAIEDVASSAREVTLRRLELLRLDAEEGLARGARSLALLLFASGFAGVFAGTLWVAAMAGLLWLTREALGLPAALAALVLLHGGLAAGVALGARRGWPRLRGERGRV
jgi:hypothetical protein